MADDYNGVISVFPYVFRHSESRLFKCYVFVGALATGIVSLFVAFGLVVLIGATAGIPGESLTLLWSSYVPMGLFVIAPLVAPILFVAHRHRRTGSKPRYNLSLALAGFVFMLSVCVGLPASVPAELQTPAEPLTMGPVTVSALVPVVRFLYDLSAFYGLVPPVACAAGIYGIRRLLC